MYQVNHLFKTMTENNFTPSSDLVHQWNEEALLSFPDPSEWSTYIATQAARWGADQELKMCCEYFRQQFTGCTYDQQLYFARRPTTAQQACDALDTYIYGNPNHKDKERTYNTIRRALDKLKELEKDN